MFRPPARAVALAVLLVVVGPAVGPVMASAGPATDDPGDRVAAAAIAATSSTEPPGPQATPDTGTRHDTFAVTVSDPEVDAEGGRTNFTFEGIEPGTPVEASVPAAPDVLPPSLLARSFPGEATSDGVRFRVPPNRTVPFALPRSASCRSGDFEFAFQRLDTGAVARDDVSVVRELVADASFARSNYTVERGGVVPIHIRNTCLSELTLRVDGIDSAAGASVSVRNDDRNATVWLDTARPAESDRLFRTEPTDDRTNTSVSAPRPAFEADDRFRLSVRYDGDELATARLRVVNGTVDARIVPSTPNRMPTPADATVTTDAGPTAPKTETPSPTTETPSASVELTVRNVTRTASGGTTTASGPGFGVLTLAVAFSAVVAVARLRRRR